MDDVLSSGLPNRHSLAWRCPQTSQRHRTISHQARYHQQRRQVRQVVLATIPLPVESLQGLVADSIMPGHVKLIRGDLTNGQKSWISQMRGRVDNSMMGLPRSQREDDADKVNTSWPSARITKDSVTRLEMGDLGRNKIQQAIAGLTSDPCPTRLVSRQFRNAVQGRH
jgi:hypothetical protein